MSKAELSQRDQTEIHRLIQQLGSENFREREAASRSLAVIGEPAEPALRRAMRHNDPEIRHRALQLVGGLVARKRNREMAALQGIWVLKTAEYLGEKAGQDPTDDDELDKLFSRQQTPAEERELSEDTRQYRTTLAFKSVSFEYRHWIRGFGSGGDGYPRLIEGTYSLDVDRSPKIMIRRWQEEGMRDEIHLRSCIYSVQGDTLRMCFNLEKDAQRLPRRFVTHEDKDVVLLTFKRERELVGSHGNQ
jgi:hypothetical protein